MQKLGLKQKNVKKLTSQQIQFLKLLQVSGQNLGQHIEKELLDNPLLEREEEILAEDQAEDIIADEIPQDSYTFSHIALQGSSVNDFIGYQEAPEPSVQASLLKELKLLSLSETELLIAQHIIGSLTEVGYLPYKTHILAEEISILHNQEISQEAVVSILEKIKEIGPPGIAAYNIQESLLLQLSRKEPTEEVKKATAIVEDHFDAFIKKNYTKIMERLGLTKRELHGVLRLLTHLRPYPIAPAQGAEVEQVLRPDFHVDDHHGKIVVTLVESKMPRLKVSRRYEELLRQHKQANTKSSKELVGFVQSNVNRAKWFIQSIAQRKRTLLQIMTAIVTLQKEFFKTGEETSLVPIFLRNVAEHIKMDVSTVSRAISHKTVQTHGKVFPLKYFFSEPIQRKDGQEVSSRAIKRIIAQQIATEDKGHPKTDEEITAILKQAGYILARRTVAKYRKQLGFSVARLRKELQVT